MTTAVILGLGAAVASGALVFERICPHDVSRRRRIALGVPLALLLGIAIHSLWFLVWLAISGGASSRLAYSLYDLALPAGLLAATRTRRSRPTGSPVRLPRPRQHPRALWPPIVLVTAGAICLASITALIVIDAASQPHGNWDAWAMWNYKARWFVWAGASWDALLTRGAPELHPDYPLLLPLTIGRLWMLTGGAPTIVPQAAAVLACGLAIALLLVGGWMFGDLVAAVCGPIALVAMPSFILQSAWQYADVPLSCFYTASLIAVALAVREGGDRRWFATAGLLAGAALWTKNEGALFAAALLISAAVVARRSTERGASIAAVTLLAGLLPFVVALFAMKIHTGAGNDLIAGQSWASIWGRLLDPSRHIQILRFGTAMAGSMFDPTSMALLLGLTVARGRSRDWRPAAAAAITVGLTAGGYYAAFLITPHDLAWHLGTAAPRLLVQLWPSAILTLCLIGAHRLPSPAAHAPAPQTAPAERRWPAGGPRTA